MPDISFVCARTLVVHACLVVDHHESSHHGDVATAVTVEETMDHECASQNTVSGKRDHNSACIAAGLGVGAGAGTFLQAGSRLRLASLCRY